MSLSAQIANLRIDADANLPVGCGEVMAYNYGLHDARHAAAELAAEADAIRDELVAALERVLRSFPTTDDMVDAWWDEAEVREACDAYDAARAALARAKGQG